jgi:hypothetical protein
MEGSDHFYRTAYAEDANRTLEVENAKLRDFASLAHDYANEFYNLAGTARDLADLNRDYADLGIEV